MPIYEYRCRQCGNCFEILVSSSSAKAPCPQCASRKTERLISTFAAHGAASVSPCDSGPCPAGGALPTGGCASGKCPFS